MNKSTISHHVKIVQDAIDQRLERFPDHPLFLFAQREVDAINTILSSPNRIDRRFYDSLNIGLMCAKELETSDPEFCSYVYDMLEEIRKSSLHP